LVLKNLFKKKKRWQQKKQDTKYKHLQISAAETYEKYIKEIGDGHLYCVGVRQDEGKQRVIQTLPRYQ